MPLQLKNLGGKYSELAGNRRDYLEWAQDAADLTLPTLRPKGEKVNIRPYTQLGTQAVRSLASTTISISMPPQVKWLKVDVSPRIKREFEGQVGVNEQGEEVTILAELEDEMAFIENDITTTLASFKTRSRLSSVMRRHMVEGNNLVNVSKDRIRFFPLRSFVVFRDAGEPVYTVVREQHIEDPFSATVAPEGQTEVGRTDDARTWMYTLIDWHQQEMYQQVQDGAIEQVEYEGDQWFIINSSIPDIEHYSTSYTYDHLGVIAEINHLSERLGEAAAVAAWNIPIIRPGANISAGDLKDWPSGTPLEEDPENLSWFTSGTKIGDWAFVAQYREQLRQELASLFAMGIKDRVDRASTATEVLQIVGELDSQTQDLLAGIEETFQRPLVDAIMKIRGYDRLNVPGGERKVQTFITTGQSALARETGFIKMVNMATQVKSTLDPTMGVRGKKLMEQAADVQQFEIGDVFFEGGQPAGGAPGQTQSMNGTGDGALVQTGGGPQREGGAAQPAK